MQTLFGVFLIGWGILCAMVPGVWKGTRAPIGRMGSTGIGVGFVSVGLAFIVAKTPPGPEMPWRNVLVVAGVILGFVLGIIGYARDTHAQRPKDRRKE